MEDSTTARAITDLQKSMLLMHEEIKVMKTSGATRAGNDPLQQPGVSDNAMNPSSSGYRSGEAQRKHDRETNYNDEDEGWEEDDDVASEDEGETLFQVSEAGNTFLETVFGKWLEAATHRKWVQKQGSGLQMDQMPRTGPSSRINSSKGDN